MNNTTTLEIGQMLSVKGATLAITAIRGRWVKLSDDTSISRGDAFAYRSDYDEEHVDDAEIAAWNDGAATPEAPDTIEDILDATGYTGPMLRLRERLQEGAYKKALNGQPCCGDVVAVTLGALTPAQVIRSCILAMALPGNPYLGLNVGQQSMNLRNKLRGCFKREEFGMGVLTEAVEQVLEEDAAAKLAGDTK